jgi:hypothetical protein
MSYHVVGPFRLIVIAWITIATIRSDNLTSATGFFDIGIADP